MQIQNHAGGGKVEQLDFGPEGRCGRLVKKNDPLVGTNEIIPREMFRPRPRSAWRKPGRGRKSSAGRDSDVQDDNSMRSLQSV